MKTDVAATRIAATIVARSDITAPQTDVEDDDVRAEVANDVHADVADDVRADVAEDVVASIDPPFTAISNFFGHLP